MMFEEYFDMQSIQSIFFYFKVHVSITREISWDKKQVSIKVISHANMA